ncbi:MAG: transcriptional regulator GlxA family with amidase domain [Parasphingorhabdus sp.]|jgi:transcriptional regulator GlxA family with amidase domain
MQNNQPIKSIGLLLLPGFALTSFALATEALRTANRQAGKDIYQCIQFSVSGEPVTSSDGTTIIPHCSIDSSPKLDMLFVCAYSNAAHYKDSRVITWLRKQAQNKTAIGAFSSGSFVLARSGLLDNHSCTIHWDDADAFREMYPKTSLTNNVYEISRNRYTCAGGTAAVDLLLNLIKQTHGVALAARVADEFIIERPRLADETQTSHRRLRQQAVSGSLDQAMELMNQEHEGSINIAEIASSIGVSQRHLGRLFQQYLQQSPGDYYRQIRLKRARRLLQKSTLQIAQIALACGFSSPSYFSQCYRRQFGFSPNRERKQAL